MTTLAKWVVGVLTAVLIAVLSPAAVTLYGHYANPAKPTHTEVRLFNSLGGSLPVADRNRGAVCLADSVSDPGVIEAHRCFVRNTIYDPCWSYAQRHVFCVDAPWETTATGLGVRRWEVAINKPASVARQEPWAVELANQQRCVLVVGATFSIAGRRANYSCDHDGKGLLGERTGWIVGYPDRSESLWHVPFAPSQSARSFDQVNVYVAWY